MKIWWMEEGTMEGDFFLFLCCHFLDPSRRYREKFWLNVRLSSENLAMRMVSLVIMS